MTVTMAEKEHNNADELTTDGAGESGAGGLVTLKQREMQHEEGRRKDGS